MFPLETTCFISFMSTRANEKALIKYLIFLWFVKPLATLIRIHFEALKTQLEGRLRGDSEACIYDR